MAAASAHDDLPELQPRRPRWLLPVGVAAAIGLGVVGLRQLDRAPTPVPAELAHPVKVKAKGGKAASVARKMDDGGDDDDDDDPNTGLDPEPDPTPPEPDPLKAAAAPANAAPPAEVAPAPSAADTAAAPTPAPSAGSTLHINVTSEPPGARMFWKGKEVGTTPFVLELQPGEKHAYEMGLPGYTTRKVVIDGSKTDISIGMRPDRAAPAGAKPRK
jgi:hypothetical protein